MSLTAVGDVIQKRFGSTSYVYCASAKYLKEYGIPKNIKALGEHHYISHAERPCDDKGKSITYVNDTQIMLELVLSGLGIAKLYKYLVDRLLRSSELVELFESHGVGQLPLFYAYPNRRFVPIKTRSFIDFFIERSESSNM